jgi:hypothetical protein
MKQSFTNIFFGRVLSIICFVFFIGSSATLQAQDDFMITFFEPGRVMANGDNDGGVPDYRETLYGNRPDSLTRYRWVAGAWEQHYGENVVYNGQGQITTATYTDLTGDMFVERLRETKTYDASNRFVSSTIAIWRENAWQDSLRSTFGFNAEGQVAEQERLLWRAGNWQRESSTLYEYVNNNRDLLAQYTIRNWVDGAYVNYYRGIYTYEEDNTSVSTMLEQEWDDDAGEGGEWMDVSSTTYAFNDEGEWTSAVTSLPGDDGEFAETIRIIDVAWHNYADRLFSEWTVQSLTDGEWVTTEAGNITYSANDGTVTTRETYTNGTLSETTRETVSFNNIGLYTGTLTEREQNEGWVTIADTVNTFVFDTGEGDPTEASRITSRTTQIFNPTTNQLENAQRVELFYITTSTEKALAVNTALDVYPNPSSDVAAVRFSLTNPASVSLQLYDVTGRMVREIAQRDMHTGDHQVMINTSALKQGVYLLRLNSNDQTQVKRIVVSH